MSEESTRPDLEEVFRRSVEAFDRGDFDAAVAFSTADAVWNASPIGMGAFKGRDAIRGLYEDLRGPYEDDEQVIEELRDLGGVTFVVLGQRARPRGSSGSVAFRYAAVGISRDRLCERVTTSTDIDEARADAERLAEERG